MDIRTVADFETALASGPYTSVGSYPVYFVTAGNTALSFKNAKKHAGQIKRAIKDRREDGWRVTGVDVNWEDPAFYDDESGERIESAYAEDRAGAARMNPTPGKHGGFVTQAGRRLKGSEICPTREEASRFLSIRKAAILEMLRSLTPAQRQKYRRMIPSEQNKFETKHGVPARIGRCTFQSASLVMHYGAGTMFARPEKPIMLPEEERAPAPSPEASEKPRDWTNWWWKRFGFDSEDKALAAGHTSSSASRASAASRAPSSRQLPAPQRQIGGFFRKSPTRQIPAPQRSAAEELGLTGAAPRRARAVALVGRQRSAAEELGIEPDHLPTKAEVKAAFAKRVLAAHPDHGGDSESFKRALAARDLLKQSAAA